MTFEEWYSVHQADCWAILKENGTKEALKEAWQAGWDEGLAEGYDVGYDDTGICPECLNEVKHKMDCGRQR